MADMTEAEVTARRAEIRRQVAEWQAREQAATGTTDTAAESSNSQLALALDTARRIGPVLPIHHLLADGQCSCGTSKCKRDPKRLGKHPRDVYERARGMGKRRGGVYAATTDRATLIAWFTKWPSANVGLHLGPARLVVVDTDGPAGVRAREALEAKHGPMPATVEEASPRGGPRGHIFFHEPLDVRCNHRDLGDELELLAGEGRYVIVRNRLPDMPIAIAPRWLLNSTSREAAPVSLAGEKFSPAPDFAPSDAPVRKGTRTLTAFRRAAGRQGRGEDAGSIHAGMQADNVRHFSPPLTTRQMTRIVDDVVGRYPRGVPLDPQDHQLLLHAIAATRWRGRRALKCRAMLEAAVLPALTRAAARVRQEGLARPARLEEAAFGLSVRDAGAAIGVRSTNTAHAILKDLTVRGWLTVVTARRPYTDTKATVYVVNRAALTTAHTHTGTESDRLGQPPRTLGAESEHSSGKAAGGRVCSLTARGLYTHDAFRSHGPSGARGLGITRAFILADLRENGAASVATLARRADMAESSLRYLLPRLERLGLVEHCGTEWRARAVTVPELDAIARRIGMAGAGRAHREAIAEERLRYWEWLEQRWRRAA